MKKIEYCKVCGNLINQYGSKKNQLCSKHAQQFRRFGKTLDTNQRSVFDLNEVRTYENYAEIDTYDQYGNVIETYILDLEDTKYLGNYKWRTVYKGKKKSPYLVTGHTIYFHRLVMGDSKMEIDHINRDTHDNRKSNLRFATRQEQLYNTLKANKSGVKGIYYNPNRPNTPWHCEFQNSGKRYYGPQCKQKKKLLIIGIYLKLYL